MNDDLRTRIAATIHKDNDFGWSKYMCEEAADAVIADLDSHGWLIDPESEDRRRRARNKRWLEGNDDDDNLRERIAAVIYDHPNPLSETQCRELADAVIRELGLEREHWQYGDGDTMGVRYRYVTEWETDD